MVQYVLSRELTSQFTHWPVPLWGSLIEDNQGIFTSRAMRFLTGVNLLCFNAGKLHQAGTSVFMLWRDATEKEERGEIARQKVAEGEAGRGEGPKEKQKEVSSQFSKITATRQLIQRPPTPTAVPGTSKTRRIVFPTNAALLWLLPINVNPWERGKPFYQQV